MKSLCRILGVARSHVHELHHRDGDWADGRKRRAPVGGCATPGRDLRADRKTAELWVSTHMRPGQSPAGCTGRRQGQSQADLPGDAQVGLLLPKAPRRRQSSRKHEGKVAVERSDLRWCSDGLEINCNSGHTVTATFAKDCCDREVMAWRAWEGRSLPGEPVREMLIEAVEKRFGTVESLPGCSSAGVPLRQRQHVDLGRQQGGSSLAGSAAGQHTGLQPAKQRYRRKLRQHVQTLLRGPYGPA
jgi:putative transposase